MKKKIFSILAAICCSVGLMAQDTPDYLSFTSTSAGEQSFQLKKNGTPAKTMDFEYSFNKVDWTPYTAGGGTVKMQKGQTVYFRTASTTPVNTIGNKDKSNYWYFSFSSGFNIGGNVMSLLDQSCQLKTLETRWVFAYLFKSNQYIQVSANLLPATTLSPACYFHMFDGCKKLATAPELPATALANCCYAYMFYNCDALTTAPELPAMELADSCYQYMFYKCTTLVNVPEKLPAMTLPKYCYSSMFYNCSALVKAPEICATGFTSAASPCSSMFSGCTSLKYIKVNFTEFTSGKTGTWLPDNNGDGAIFEGPKALFQNMTERSKSTVPANWTFKISDDYLIIKAVDSDITLSTAAAIGNPVATTGFLYSMDKKVWNDFALGSTSFTIPAGQSAYFRSASETALSAISGNDANNQWKFTMSGSGSVEVEGNVMFLLNNTEVSAYGLASLFKGCTQITNVDKNLLPATELAEGCYQSMFEGCSNLQTAPELKVSTLVSSCYAKMFKGCSSLQKLVVNFTNWSDATTDWLDDHENATFVGPHALMTALESAGRSVNTVPTKWNNESFGCLSFTAKNAPVALSMEKVGSIANSPLEYSFNQDNWTEFVQGETVVNIPANQTMYLRTSSSSPLLTFNQAATTTPNPTTTKAWRFVMADVPDETAGGTIEVGGNVMALLDKTCQLTTVPQGSFGYLFDNCTKITNVSENLLPATMVDNYGYVQMFNGCSNLKNAPKLPATTIGSESYAYMFQSCTSLESAEIDATTFGGWACEHMFTNCTAMKSVTVHFTTWPDEHGETVGWLHDHTDATFYGPSELIAALESKGRSESTVPEKWNIGGAVTTLVLNDNEDNASVLLANLDKEQDIQLMRTFQAGMWNTVCLPFALDASQIAAAFGEGTQVGTMTRAEMVNEELILGFNTNVTTMDAGYPYIIRLGDDENVVNPTFEGVTITTTDAGVNTSDDFVYKFVGTFSPVTDYTPDVDLYLGTGNTVHPISGGTLNGFRAYFAFNNPEEGGEGDDAPADAPTRIRLVINNTETVTADEQLRMDEATSTKMMVNGQLMIMRDGIRYNAQGQEIQ